MLKNVRIPIRPHFGVMGARAGRGRHRRLDPAELHRRQHRQLAHRQGRDDVLPGRGRRRAVLGRRSARVAGRLRAVRHRDRVLADGHLPADPAQGQASSRARRSQALAYPLLETQTEYLVHGFSFPNYLAALGPKAQSEIYSKSSVDLALRDAFRKMRHFLMTTQGLSEDEAISLMSVGRRLRHHPGRRRQLGRARGDQEEPVRGRLNGAEVARIEGVGAAPAPHARIRTGYGLWCAERAAPPDPMRRGVGCSSWRIARSSIHDSSACCCSAFT